MLMIITKKTVKKYGKEPPAIKVKIRVADTNPNKIAKVSTRGSSSGNSHPFP
jgi:hypothetical protein